MEPKDSQISDDALAWARGHRNEIVGRFITGEFLPVEKPVSFFMAGSPGAGKTETSINLIDSLQKRSSEKILRIDPDELRDCFPGYNGSNSSLFQRAVSIGVERLMDKALDKKLNFVLDGTLSSYEVAKKNIERSLKRGRPCTIIYVYQDPIVAWRFTLIREQKEGRRITKDDFIKKFFASRDVVNKLKQEFGSQIEIWLVEKNFEENTERTRINVDNIDNHVKQTYDQETLERLII